MGILDCSDGKYSVARSASTSILHRDHFENCIHHHMIVHQLNRRLWFWSRPFHDAVVSGCRASNSMPISRRLRRSPSHERFVISGRQLPANHGSISAPLTGMAQTLNRPVSHEVGFVKRGWRNYRGGRSTIWERGEGAEGG
jgi:hypothetical protein